MMNAFAVPGDKLGDGGIVRCRFEQLEPALADGNHHEPDFFVLHDFFGRNAEAEFFVDGLGSRQGLHCDAEMINLKHSASPEKIVVGQNHATAETFAPARSEALSLIKTCPNECVTGYAVLAIPL